MPPGTEVCLGPGHIVLDVDPAPPHKGAQQPPLLQFTACCKLQPMCIVAKQLDGSGFRIPLGTEVGLGPVDIVLVAEPAPPPPQFYLSASSYKY